MYVYTVMFVPVMFLEALALNEKCTAFSVRYHFFTEQ